MESLSLAVTTKKIEAVHEEGILEKRIDQMFPG